MKEEKTITLAMIKKGLKAGALVPELGKNGLMCHVGLDQFYFGGAEFEYTHPDDLPLNVTAQLIKDVLDDFAKHKDTLEEYAYCLKELSGCRLPDKSRPEDVGQLLIVNFATGDSSCPYWMEARLVRGAPLGETITKALSKQVDEFNENGEDYEFSDVVDEVLTRLGTNWCVPPNPAIVTGTIQCFVD